MKLDRKQLGHALIALGGGLAVFLHEVGNITGNPYLQAGCLAGQTVLFGLGIGVVKRSA